MSRTTPTPYLSTWTEWTLGGAWLVAYTTSNLAMMLYLLVAQ